MTSSSSHTLTLKQTCITEMLSRHAHSIVYCFRYVLQMGSIRFWNINDILIYIFYFFFLHGHFHMHKHNSCRASKDTLNSIGFWNNSRMCLAMSHHLTFLASLLIYAAKMKQVAQRIAHLSPTCPEGQILSFQQSRQVIPK